MIRFIYVKGEGIDVSMDIILEDVDD